MTRRAGGNAKTTLDERFVAAEPPAGSGACLGAPTSWGHQAGQRSILPDMEELMHAVTLVIACLSLAATAGTPVPQKGGDKPGREHEVLARLLGTWDTSTAGGAGKTSRGVATFKSGPGGLWVLADESREIPTGSLVQHGMLGFDHRKKKFVMAWADSWNAHLAVAEGSLDEAGQTLTFEISHTNPQTGQPHVEMHRYTFNGPDHLTFTISGPGPDKTEMTYVTTEYQRQK